MFLWFWFSPGGPYSSAPPSSMTQPLRGGRRGVGQLRIKKEREKEVADVESGWDRLRTTGRGKEREREKVKHLQQTWTLCDTSDWSVCGLMLEILVYWSKSEILIWELVFSLGLSDCLVRHLEVSDWLTSCGWSLSVVVMNVLRSEQCLVGASFCCLHYKPSRLKTSRSFSFSLRVLCFYFTISSVQRNHCNRNEVQSV